MNSQSSAQNSNLALTVSELNRQARNLLERSFLTIHVEGEISNFVCPSSGHWYFTLKDDKAQVRCAMFRNRNQLVRIRPQQGDKVLLRAKVSLYEGRGEYQLICDFMEPSGSGSLQQAYEELKAKLDKEGLFDSSHKQPVPKHPKRIGVITSPTGAAIHDVLTVLKRRFPSLPVTLYPTAVQGNEAPSQICRALLLAEIDNRCDALIVGRGGGSLEDLSVFNSEQVARALFTCPIPTISAVGHEVDIVITDFIADMRAATPSAAAELLSPDQAAQLQQIRHYRQRLQQLIKQKLVQDKFRLERSAVQLKHPEQLLREQAQKLDQLELRLKNQMRRILEKNKNILLQQKSRLGTQSPHTRLALYQQTIPALKQRLLLQIKVLLKQKRNQLITQGSQLNAISPLATLERGYAIVRDKNQQVIDDAQKVQPGSQVETLLHKGRIQCTVDTIIPE